jgi:hypothetical protein
MPDRITYDPNTTVIAQNDGWSCSVTSLRWAMTAMGRNPAEGWMEGTALVEGVVRMADGLQDATGAGLAAFVRRHYVEFGYDANNEASISFEDARFEGNHAYPILIGGRAWNHWCAVRDYDEANGVLRLANPANGHKDVFQTMSKGQFGALGPFSMVRVFHPDIVP